MNYNVYTDGACSGNPGVGGWAFIIIPDNHLISRVYGHNLETTNNRMELYAIIKALKYINSMVDKYARKRYTINVYSDSTYCINPIVEGWIARWKKNNWITSSNTPVKNQDLWEELDSLIEQSKFDINFYKVKGHSGNRYNEEVDKLAKKAVKVAKSGVNQYVREAD